ncbi:MAG: hypothetical protein IKX00_02270 [Bacilli bacterium]|nr:hypothetical protein [Bacilli bacterium]
MYILGKLNELDKVSEFMNFIKDHKGLIIFIFMAVLILVIVYYIFIMFTDKTKENTNIVDENTETKEYLKDVPCKGDLFITYFVLSKSNLIDYLTVKGNFISSIYLSWIKKGLIKTKSIDKGDNQLNLYFDNTNITAIDSEIEKKLYESIKNGITVNQTGVFKLDELVKSLVSSNQIIVNFLKESYEEGKKRIIKTLTNSYELNEDYNVEPCVQELKKQIVSFQNYLINFANGPENESASVYVLDNYYEFSKFLDIHENIKNTWISNKVNADMVKVACTDLFSNINEYAHTNNLYSDTELKKHKKAIKKSEKAFNNVQKKEFFHA